MSIDKINIGGVDLLAFKITLKYIPNLVGKWINITLKFEDEEITITRLFIGYLDLAEVATKVEGSGYVHVRLYFYIIGPSGAEENEEAYRVRAGEFRISTYSVAMSRTFSGDVEYVNGLLCGELVVPWWWLAERDKLYVNVYYKLGISAISVAGKPLSLAVPVEKLYLWLIVHREGATAVAVYNNTVVFEKEIKEKIEAENVGRYRNLALKAFSEEYDWIEGLVVPIVQYHCEQ